MEYMSDAELATLIVQRRTEESTWRQELCREAGKKRSAWLDMVAEKRD